jgi:serine/threonine protein kinase/tetratricopeptide (TPR) repeat protein
MNEREIFIEAAQVNDPVEQAAFLRRTCGQDEALHRQLVDLLAAHSRAQSFLESPPSGIALAVAGRDATQAPPVTEGPGTKIGSYKLLQQIGEGGFGVVYMAEQEKPVFRKVALKIIKPGMDTKEVISRFESERQALALMDHPNIAKVLDAGATGSGRPYFVMELVKGIPLIKFCDDNHLPPEERLELFIEVCNAIQHAHQKGIIHRDLKPSNVMVTLHDGRPVPKVIDFGVAKATSHRLTERTLFTAYGQVIGTPAYMSPEQAEMSGLDIDTRSDVYSLGVLLYELLTGATPFEAKRLREAGFAEMQRIIREEEPPRPSTRVSTMQGAALSTLSQHHGIDERRMRQVVRGELDWIVMKSLDKDRERRYESAGSFARDIRRYLSDEPVQACPPSAGYRLRKFARRNKTTLVMVSFVTAALVAGTVVSTWQAIRAERSLVEAQRQRNLAEANLQQAEQQRALAESSYKQAERQRGLAESSYKQAEQQKALAESSYQQARRAVDELFVHMGDDVTLNQPEFQPLRAELLRAALRYYQEFIATWKDEPAKQAEIAASYRRVADLTQQIGAQPQAESAYQAALALKQKLAAEGGDGKRTADLAYTWMMLGRSQLTAGHYDDAAHSFDEALGIFRRLAEQEPLAAQYQGGIAVVLDNVGYLHSVRGQLDEAVKYHEQSVEINERLVHDQPEDPLLKFRLATSYSNLGDRLTAVGRYDEALVAHNKRLVLLRELVQQRGPRRVYEEEIGSTLNFIGDVYRNSRRQPEWFGHAIAAYQEARGIQERLLKDYPTSITIQSHLANTLANMGHAYRWHKDYAEALQASEESIVLLEKLVGTNPQGIIDLGALGLAYAEKGRVLVALKRSAEAVAPYEKAVAAHKRLVRLAPSIQRYQRELEQFQLEMERAQKGK